jgi:hypothetical protein
MSATKNPSDSVKSTAVQRRWSNKISVSREAGMILGLGFLGVLLFFKMKPYFETQTVILPLGRGQMDPSKNREAQARIREGLERSQMILRPETGQSAPKAAGFGGGSRLQGRSTSLARNPHVLERPLFDNQTLTLHAVLTNGISTAQAEQSGLGVEARITGIIPDPDHEVDLGGITLDGALLTGTATPRFQIKKMNLQFSEMVTAEGHRYAGMASRLLGVTIGRAIQTADSLATARVLENTQDADPLRREIMRQSMEASNQPVNDINQEVTRDLRETKATLSLDAGAPLVIKMRAMDARGARP